MDSNHTNVDRAVQFVDEIVKLCPVYYVTGNHEYWLDTSEYEEFMAGLDDRNLSDGTLDGLLKEKNMKGNKDEHDEINGNTQDATQEGLKNKVQDVAQEDSWENEFTVVLAHEPQYLARYASTGVDLVLSGHAHGGQFRLPFVI